MFNLDKIKKFLIENKGQGEWNTLYMVLIVAIIALVLLTKIKPMFKQSVKLGTSQEGIVSPNNPTGTNNAARTN